MIARSFATKIMDMLWFLLMGDVEGKGLRTNGNRRVSKNQSSAIYQRLAGTCWRVRICGYRTAQLLVVLRVDLCK